jgi:hypothetical protein
MKTLMMILALALTGCGDIYVDGGKATPASDDTSATLGTGGSDAGPPAADSGAPAAPSACRAPAAPAWVYVPNLASYQDALQAAPAGYRLPTRAELIVAFDQGAIHGYDVVVWTATDAIDRSDYTWTIRLRDGYPEIQWKRASFAALYVK